MILGAIGEWIIGNTFPFVVFGTFGMYSPCLGTIHELCPRFSTHHSTIRTPLDRHLLKKWLGAFWLTFGGTLDPTFNAYGAYITDPAKAATQMGQPGNPAGLQTPAFNASFAFFLVFMGA